MNMLGMDIGGVVGMVGTLGTLWMEFGDHNVLGYSTIGSDGT
jgi:hypothetical protein